MPSLHEVADYTVTPPSCHKTELITLKKKVIGVKTTKLAIGSNTGGNGVLSVVELTRIELATS